MPPLRPIKPSNPEQVAINLFDLDRISGIIRATLLGGKLDLSAHVRVNDDKVDEIGVAFNCKLLVACCICDVIRLKDRKAGDYPTRVYYRLSSKHSWIKVAGEVMLAVQDQHGTRPNPALFPSAIVRTAPVPIAVQPVRVRKQMKRR